MQLFRTKLRFFFEFIKRFKGKVISMGLQHPPDKKRVNNKTLYVAHASGISSATSIFSIPLMSVSLSARRRRRLRADEYISHSRACSLSESVQADVRVARLKRAERRRCRTTGNMPILHDVFYCRDKRPCCVPSVSTPRAAPTRLAKRYECNLYFCALMDIFSLLRSVLRARRSSYSQRLTEGTFFMAATEKKRDKPPSTGPRAVLRETMTMAPEINAS